MREKFSTQTREPVAGGSLQNTESRIQWDFLHRKYTEKDGDKMHTSVENCGKPSKMGW